MAASLPMNDAECMDHHYRFQRHIYDATRTHYLLGRRELIRRLKPPAGASALEIGCGTAWNLVRAAKLYPQTDFLGLDVSNAMLATARRSLTRHGLHNRIVLRQGDATDFSALNLFGRPAMDRVFFSYALTMIPGWTAALEQAAGCLAPRGSLHVADFGQCENLPRAFKRMLEAFLAHFSVYPRSDMELVLRGLAARRSLDISFERLHRGYTVHAVLRRR